jgi:amino-acid N-acetyltransferase
MASGVKALTVRPATHDDMLAIRSLIGRYPQQLVQQDLPRPASFVVAVSADKIVGCCALQIYSRRLAELRSLAIDPDFIGLGIAKTLVERCLRRARERNVKQVLAVSSEAAFFERCGFSTFFREKTALFYDVPAKPDDRS